MPPVADCLMPWDGPVADTVAAIGTARSSCGDTFAIDSGRDRYLFLFSAQGLQEFYAVPEQVASKGVADWKMLVRKLPQELFEAAARRPTSCSGAPRCAATSTRWRRSSHM